MTDPAQEVPWWPVGIWRVYAIPIILGSISILCIAIAISLLLKSTTSQQPIQFSSDMPEASVAGVITQEIMVDISGGVVAPGVYRMTENSRVEDVIQKAGGLSAEADVDKIAATINRVARVSDGAKIYIPTLSDETSMSIPVAVAASDFSSNTHGVSINAASQSELEALPGVGPVTAGKIISGRPYGSLEELVDKKAVGRSLLEKLRSYLTL
jgi:comEA protein